MLPRPFVVNRVRKETADTFTLELEPADGSPLAFAPGQFNQLYAFGVGEAPISISGDADEPSTLIHTVRAVGAVTKAICASKTGAQVGVRGPFGKPWPVDESQGRDIVIVAGGIGLAPIRPVIYRLLARRRKYGRIIVLYGTRTPHDLLYAPELHRWRGRFDMDVEVTVDHAGGEIFERVGVVTQLIPQTRFDAHDATAMVCGPEVMMRFTIRDLLQRGLAPEDIYVSMERNMKCAVGFCGHCQLGPYFVCKDGPVFRYSDVEPWIKIREV